MRVTVAGIEYKITWEHDPIGALETACAIQNSKDGTFTYGYAHLHPKDRYVKETGRKISLAKALSILLPYTEDNDRNANLVKFQRRLVWDAYFARKSN